MATPDRQHHPVEDQEELVPVMVPKSALPAVTAVLHRHFAGEALSNETERAIRDQAGADTEQVVEVPDNGPWTQGDIGRLHRSFRNPDGRKAIDLIAQRSLHNDFASYGELMEHAGLTEYELRSQFSWFSKKGKALKGTEKGCWPMTVTDAGSDAAKGTRYSYRMHPQIARWWLDQQGDNASTARDTAEELS